jgi:hypothetical protein
MRVHDVLTWKLGLAVVLGGAILVSLRARAPRRAIPHVDLRRLVGSALVLYAVGALAWFTHHRLLAASVYAAGIVTAALAAWLSRGRDAEDPRRGAARFDDHPPLDPDPLGPGEFDWESFERDFQAYSEGRHEPAGLD